MRKIYRIMSVGLLACALSATAFAHDYSGYQGSGWTGSATVWGNSMGHSGYSGTVGYGGGYGYAPAYIPWAGGPHGPQCHHGPPGHAYGRGYDRGYHKGYRKGRKHGRKHRGRHH